MKTAGRSGEGRDVGWGWVQADYYQNIFGNIRTYAISIVISIRTLCLDAMACFVFQATFVMLTVLSFFQILLVP